MRFNRAAALALAEIDVPRIVKLELDGQAIAFTYYFALEGRAFLHRMAFDPAFGRVSPGLTNMRDALQVGASEGLTRFEFLGGADRYKIELADRFEPLHLGLGLAGTPVGRAIVDVRCRWLWLRETLKRSATARSLYEGLAPARRLLTRPKDIMRPSGVRQAGE
jgi:CelD/BcsL family acetyltransferase involved in cellulose biosynthesis